MAISVIRVKPEVKFDPILPGGFVILAAILGAAQSIGHDVTITSGTDGIHSGPTDPHKRGEAYDVRTHDIPNKLLLLTEIQRRLDLNHFYTFLEDANTDNEHIHSQVKRNTVYPPVEDNIEQGDESVASD